MKKLVAAAALIVAFGGCATQALADDYPLVTKAPMYTAPAKSAACGSVYDFFFTACPLTWYGISVYGTVDMGGSYQTHGSPFDPNFTTGASYLLNKPSRIAEWTRAPNGLSQSVVGVKISESFAPGWSVVGQGELAFDPYSALLANAPQALQNSIGVPQNLQEIPVDSSRWGWLAGQIYSGVSSPIYGTVTFGRQNTLNLDLVNAYDPMGGSYAFSPIGFSGATCGSGDTEECRYTTAIKYRLNVGDFRLGVIGQPLRNGAYNPNNGAIQGDIGGDVRRLGPGTLSLDVVGAYDRDAVNIGPTGGVSPQPGYVGALAPQFLQATISNQASVTVGAKYSFGSFDAAPVLGKAAAPPPSVPLTLYAGYEYVQFSNPSDPQTAFYDDGFLFSNAGGSITGAVAGPNGTAINNNAYNGLCGGGTAGSATCSNKIFQVAWIGAKYGITKNLDVIGAYYYYNQNQYGNTPAGTYCTGAPTTTAAGALGNGSSAHGQCAGTEDFWSAVIDWRFLPKWDAYLGTFFSQVNGGLAAGYLARNNLATTAGVRFRF